MNTIHQSFLLLREHLQHNILGQSHLVNQLLVALLADGHLLVEGAPGLAKTTAIKTLSECIEGDFHRIQFTPDLLPADIIGTEVYRPETGEFTFQAGPVFHNLILADEVNRAPAKVQSALLEAMGERQVTVGQVTHNLSDLFLVMATQNPIEQEGTYPLPEAQLDRFLLHVSIDPPDSETEKKILHLVRAQHRGNPNPNAMPTKISQQHIFTARQQVNSLHMAEALDDYIVAIVMATRQPQAFSQPDEDADLARWISYGASPRATLALDRCARAHAWLAGQDFVSPDDIKTVAADVLRHRIIVSFEAEADGIDSDHVINEILQRVPTP